MQLRPTLRACSGTISTTNLECTPRLDVVSAQQRLNDQHSVHESACQWFPRFGTMGRNFSSVLRRFSMAGAKSSIPCQFYPLEERLNEQEARRRRRRGRACSPVGCASTNRERHTVRPAECRLRIGQRQTGRRVEPDRLTSELELVASWR